MKNLMIIMLLMGLVLGCKDAEKEVMKFSKTVPVKSLCIGQSIFELPISLVPAPVVIGIFTPKNIDLENRPIDLIVFTSKTSEIAYAEHNRKREFELRELASENINVLKLVKVLNENQTLFRLQAFEDGYVSELSYLLGETLVSATVKSFDKQFELAESHLLSLAGHLKKYGPDDIPPASGFCLGDLVLMGDYKSETASYTALDKNGTRVTIDVDTYARNEKIDLLSRVSGPNSLLTLFNVDHTVLRARERQIAGMRAQEWLSWARLSDQNDVRTHTFELETMRETPSRLQPLITMTLVTAQPLSNGTYAKESTPDEEAIMLWDRIVSSIRPVKQS